VEIVLSVLASLLALLFPGAVFLPTLLKKTNLSLLSALALMPIISITANYFLLYSLNAIGFNFNLGAIFVFYVLVALFMMIRSRNEIISRLNLGVLDVVFPLITLVSTSYVWLKSFRGYSWIAPNADGYAHNLYVTRILDLNSVIGDHVFAATPLIKTLEFVEGFYFYPLAWHASVAPAADLFRIPAPTMALSSTLVFWSFVFPLGLIALSKLWFKDFKAIGVSAAVISQTIPLMPGVPMTWGAMTSVIGIALIPSLLISITLLRRHFTIANLVLSLLLTSGLFFVHPPEAVYIGILLGIAVLAQFFLKSGATSRKLALSGVLAVLIIMVILRNQIASQVATMEGLMGGAERSINETLGSLLTLSINTTTNQLLLALLFIIGIYLLNSVSKDRSIELSLVVAVSIYLVSGANTWPLEKIRILTIPWYASYERTSWQLVPIVSLVAAIPIGIMAHKVFNARFSLRSSVMGTALALTITLQTVAGIQGQSEQIRKGLQQNQIAGPGSRTLFEKAKSIQDSDSYFLTVRGDGSAYAYMFNDVAVSNGPYGKNGLPSESLAEVSSSLASICKIDGIEQTIASNNLSGVIVGSRRYAWETAPYSKNQILNFKGFEAVAISEDLVLLQFDLDKC
jgi:hypothetical protein